MPTNMLQLSPDQHNAIAIVVTQWHANPSGAALQAVPFPKAVEAQCHANATAYTEARGGVVVHGFLIEHPQAAPWVYVRAHSVVRDIRGKLVDPTLTAENLHRQAFFEYIGPTDTFGAIAQDAPEVMFPIYLLDSHDSGEA